MPSTRPIKQDGCCNRGGARPGCGRKPGVPTRPVRLPEWLLDELEKQGDARELIVQACKQSFQLSCGLPEDTTNNGLKND